MMTTYENHVRNSNYCAISYSDIRLLNGSDPFPMSLTGDDEIQAVVNAVNQGIDSHLEACNSPQRGDSYAFVNRMVGDLVICRALDCRVSAESLPTLLRRLAESGDDAGESLANDILYCLGFDESGNVRPTDD